MTAGRNTGVVFEGETRWICACIGGRYRARAEPEDILRRVTGCPPDVVPIDDDITLGVRICEGCNTPGFPLGVSPEIPAIRLPA